MLCFVRVHNVCICYALCMCVYVHICMSCIYMSPHPAVFVTTIIHKKMVSSYFTVFRMGNSLELGQKALDALSMSDPTLRNLAVTAHSMKALWLLLDHTIWCGKTEIIKVCKFQTLRVCHLGWVFGRFGDSLPFFCNACKPCNASPEVKVVV